MTPFLKKILGMNWVLVFVMYGLLIFGVFMIESAARNLAVSKDVIDQYGSAGAYYAAMQKQWILLGSVAWGHTLTRLWASVPVDWTPDPPPPQGLEDRLRLLDGFYIPTRYPDSYPEGTPGEHFGRLQSEQAIAHASVVIHWIGAAMAERRGGA